MNTKQLLQSDYINAVKTKNETAKLAISSLKADILNSEKVDGKELSEEQILKVILSNAKKRKQSIDEYTKYGRTDLVQIETDQYSYIEKYLPKKLNESEIKEKLSDIIKTNFTDLTNKNMVVGKTMGLFNKQYPGDYDSKQINSFINEIVNENISR